MPASSRQALTPAELDEIWAALAGRRGRDRYRAIAFLRLIWAAGLRRGQALSLLRSDLHLDKSGGGWVPSPRPRTKKPRAKQPPRYLDSETVKALQKYLSDERPPYNGRVREPLFITEDGTPFSLEGFGSWLAKIADDIERLTPLGIKWTSDLMSHTWKVEAAQSIRDQELRRRCEKFLRAIGDHDQAVREACVVLEDRVRKVSGATIAQLSSNLMEWAFGGKSPRVRLSDHSNEQRGVMEMYRGIMAFYRGGTAHALRDDFDPNEALRIVSWVDHLLGLLGEAERPIVRAIPPCRHAPIGPTRDTPSR